jgi:hypothetical protein
LDKVSYSKEKVDKITQESLDLPDVSVMVGYSSAQPAQQEWVGLTDEEAIEIGMQYQWYDGDCERFDSIGFTYAIEARLKEKNTKKG